MNSGKKACLSQAKEEASSNQASEIVNQTHSRHADSPQNHNDRQKNRGFEPFEQDLGQWLNQGVGDKEHREGQVVLEPNECYCLTTVVVGVSIPGYLSCLNPFEGLRFSRFLYLFDPGRKSSIVNKAMGLERGPPST